MTIKLWMKTIKYSINCAIVGLISLNTSYAQNVEQIYMKSGSVVEGYIAEQNPGKHITIQASKATIVASSDSLQNRIIERIPLESLSDEWRKWAEENNKLVDNNGIKQLELSTLEFNNCRYSNVYLLEKGSIIKFLDLTPNRYRFVWGDMYRTVKSERPDNLFSGLKEILVLHDGSIVVGQIIEQFPGSDLKIAVDNDEILSFKFSQIKQIKTEKLTESLDLWSQIQLLDKITIKGVTQELVGFISSRTLGKEVVFEFEDGSSRIIPQNQITSYAKLPNDKYVAVYDKILKDGEILLNNQPAYFVELESHDQYLLLGDVASIQSTVGDNICLEAKLADANTPITLVKAHLESITRKNGKRKEQVLWPVFSYQDLIQAHQTIKREYTPLGNIKVSFDLKEVGDYILYIQGRNEYIVINVVEKQDKQDNQ